jgi:ribosomal protein L7Ae-like RNA K-turn-binding protein
MRRSSAEVEQALTLAGFAARAGQVVTGTERVRAAVRDGAARLVLLASDASPTQVAKLVPLLGARMIPSYPVASRERLGRAVGKAPLSALALLDPALARRCGELLARASTEEP